MASIGRIVISEYWQELGVLLVEAIAADILGQTPGIRNPPRHQMKNGPERLQRRCRPHSNTSGGHKAPSEPEQQNSDHDVRIELVISNGEAKLSVPSAQGQPAVNFVINEQENNAGRCQFPKAWSLVQIAMSVRHKGLMHAAALSEAG